MHRVYRYVGPPAIAAAAARERSGTAVRSAAELRAALAEIAPRSRGQATCGWEEPTLGQRRKPLVGSGRAAPVAFEVDGVTALLVASDGLASYASAETLCGIVDAAPAVGHALLDAVRLPSGRLRDDASAIVVRCG